MYIKNSVSTHFDKVLEEYKDKLRKRRSSEHAAKLLWGKYREFYIAAMSREVQDDQEVSLANAEQELVDVLEEYAPFLPETIAITIDQLLEYDSDEALISELKKKNNYIISLFREVFT